MTRLLLPLARASFWLAFLVVLAGSVVRMTGSGMGCPDWPKCFGLLVPPTDVTQVTYTLGEPYKAGQMLLVDDQFWVAQTDLVAADFLEEEAQGDWLPYAKHDYAIFNPISRTVDEVKHVVGSQRCRQVRSVESTPQQHIYELTNLGAGDDLGHGHHQRQHQAPTRRLVPPDSQPFQPLDDDAVDGQDGQCTKHVNRDAVGNQIPIHHKLA